uniref:Uncharacterized protein n=1 Tax=Rhizophora mucronata TaxID=61149 RepID=A0A2P2QK78_RHIMU
MCMLKAIPLNSQGKTQNTLPHNHTSSLNL